MQGLSPKLAKFLAEKQQQEVEAARPAAPRPSRRQVPAADREAARPTHTHEQAAAEQQQQQHPAAAWNAAAAAKQAAAEAAHSPGSSTQVTQQRAPSASVESGCSSSPPAGPSPNPPVAPPGSIVAAQDPPALAKPWQPGGQAAVGPAEMRNVNMAAKPPARALGRSSSSRAAAKLHQLVLIARGEGRLPAEAPAEGGTPLAGRELSPAHSAPADDGMQGSHQAPARALGRSRSAAAGTSRTMVPRGDAAETTNAMSHAEPTTSAPATWREVSLCWLPSNSLQCPDQPVHCCLGCSCGAAVSLHASAPLAGCCATAVPCISGPGQAGRILLQTDTSCEVHGSVSRGPDARMRSGTLHCKRASHALFCRVCVLSENLWVVTRICGMLPASAPCMQSYLGVRVGCTCFLNLGHALHTGACQAMLQLPGVPAGRS